MYKAPLAIPEDLSPQVVLVTQLELKFDKQSPGEHRVQDMEVSVKIVLSIFHELNQRNFLRHHKKYPRDSNHYQIFLVRYFSFRNICTLDSTTMYYHNTIFIQRL